MFDFIKELEGQENNMKITHQTKEHYYRECEAAMNAAIPNSRRSTWSYNVRNAISYHH